MTTQAGDVFELRLSDGRFGYGVVVIGGGTPYVIILRSVFAARPELTILADDEIALVGKTMDTLIHHGRWVVVGSTHPERGDIPFPNWKVEIAGVLMISDFYGRPIRAATGTEAELLDFQTSRSPIAFHNAIEALHGLQEWRPSYDCLTCAYASERVLGG